MTEHVRSWRVTSVRFDVGMQIKRELLYCRLFKEGVPHGYKDEFDPVFRAYYEIFSFHESSCCVAWV